MDGELVDVINNMPLVRAFGATLRERQRFSDRVEQETSTRGRSLRYLEKLRLLHAAVTAGLTAGLLAWAILLWEAGAASPGDVVLVTTLGFTILHGTRDLAVALVDTIQHVARLSEALATLLLPHELKDAEDAHALERPRGALEFRDVSYVYPASSQAGAGPFQPADRGRHEGGAWSAGPAPASRPCSRWRSGCGTCRPARCCWTASTSPSLTQDSLHDAIGVVPQDVSLFHRSVLDNIRYGRPNASDKPRSAPRPRRPAAASSSRPCPRVMRRRSAIAG